MGVLLVGTEMSEAYASAMVTVIPVILLVAAIETSRFSSVIDEVRLQRANKVLEEAREGRVLSPDLPKAVVRWHLASYCIFGLLWISHLWAEMNLIFWLSYTEKDPDPALAVYVKWTAITGFWLVMFGAAAQRQVAAWSQREEREALLDEAQALMRRKRSRLR
ncbi:hypothetical protein SVTN_40320 (plasmid) [Streptomyces vietnamensis]|uniref:Uncharacterized protein n=1 Tax=Streptomyces vietnamensis TaxID=362257 RepID=A0A0B5IIY1_9ACTN|nr:hypothetical protein SVTN_40320 [Streptomyces vietnamensis]